jgi:hypothetical protein
MYVFYFACISAFLPAFFLIPPYSYFSSTLHSISGLTVVFPNATFGSCYSSCILRPCFTEKNPDGMGVKLFLVLSFAAFLANLLVKEVPFKTGWFMCSSWFYMSTVYLWFLSVGGFLSGAGNAWEGGLARSAAVRVTPLVTGEITVVPPAALRI